MSKRHQFRPTASQAARLTEDEIDAMMEAFAKEDDYRTKTWSRRLVEQYLSKFAWYFPRKDIRGAPSLSKAYAYYEHVTLPRHFVDDTTDHILRRAEPGEAEAKTELYDPFRTPPSALIEWGIGIDLYFSSLRAMVVILFLAGLINLPNIFFYASSNYSPNGQEGLGIFSLQGTAICTTFDWVVCSDCTPEAFGSTESQERYGIAEDGTVLVQRNECDGGALEQGMVNWATFLFVSIAMALFSIYLRAREIRFDEDKLTSTDYSVIVKNPPPDAYNPDEWRDFFAQFADKQVTAVTVALNNGKLLNKLIARRIHRNNLRIQLPKGTDLEDEDVVRAAVSKLVQERSNEPQGCLMRSFDCLVRPITSIFGMFLLPERLVDKVFSLTEDIKELQKEKYEVTKVFVTFETEEGQRAALEALAVGKLDIMFQNTSNSAPSALFKGKVLKVEEPTEPSAVRWRDLQSSAITRIAVRAFNLLATLAMVTLSGYIVNRVREQLGPGFAGPLISTVNSVIPQIVKILMIFEPHTTEGSFQTSLYLKITLFRWINTAVLTKLITPFTSTVTDGNKDLIKSIHALLWSELWLVPFLRLTDYMGNLKKHILAPRARTQELMNSWFQGTYYNLGERYTDLTKVLFLCFFYSALFPSTFFFGAAILAIQYFSDKYCLMRIWSWTPFLGSELAVFSRRYFFSGSCLALAMVSAYAWAQFPFDNLCDPVEYNGPDVSGVYSNVRLLNEVDVIPEVTVTQATPSLFCSQSWREVAGFTFPPTSRIQPDDRRWMTDSQETLTDTYGWTAVVVIVSFVLYYFGSAIVKFMMSWVMGVYEPKGQIQYIDFSSNVEIFAYVPQIKLIGFPFPFLACDIDRMDQDLIGWNDPTKSYDYYNLIFDVPWEGMPRKKIIEGNTRNTEYITEQQDYKESSDRPGVHSPSSTGVEVGLNRFPIFSIVRHYPPAWARQE